jgi:hypothetical protein
MEIHSVTHSSEIPKDSRIEVIRAEQININHQVTEIFFEMVLNKYVTICMHKWYAFMMQRILI